jgi:peptidoglycan/xylan/chitin deacetylase (PgdA/CDA1 family)
MERSDPAGGGDAEAFALIASSWGALFSSRSYGDAMTGEEGHRMRRAAASRRALLVAAAAAGLAACDGRSGRQAAGTPATNTAPPTTRAAAQPGGPRRGPARVIFAGSRNRRQVALTFHGSGAPPLVSELLSLVDRAGVPITVFAVGSWLEQHPVLGRRILAGGHELANHTYTHPALGRLSPAEVAHEIRACQAVLQRLSGSGGRWFRPSAMTVPTPLVRVEAAAAGYAVVVAFDVDPRDYADPGAGVVAARVTAGLRPGAIVSLHTGHAGTVAALPSILSAMRARGLAPVGLRQLLAGMPGVG